MTAATPVTSTVTETGAQTGSSGTGGPVLPTVQRAFNGAGAVNDLRSVCGAGLFEVAVRTAECLHQARRCGDGMRAFRCAWEIVCSAGVTDPKFVANCLIRLGTAHLTCGCRPTAIAKLGRTQGHDEHAADDRHTLAHVLAELIALIVASPPAGTAPNHGQPTPAEDGTCGPSPPSTSRTGPRGRPSPISSTPSRTTNPPTWRSIHDKPPHADACGNSLRAPRKQRNTPPC